MNTTKRPVAQLRVNDDSISRYSNQMTFKGIVLNNNPYDVDQLSLKDAKNVYVDDNGTLISRPPIVVDTLPIVYNIVNNITYPTAILRPNYLLVDVFETSKVIVYISKYGNLYDINAVYKTNSELARFSDVTSYHLSEFENYIILFNNINAMILNITEFNLGWRALNNFVEIPVTKRVVGQESFTYPKNQFTEDYKEEYIMSDDVISVIPEGTAEVEVTQSPDNLKWTLENAYINPEFRILRSLNVEVQTYDIISTAINATTGINVLAIAKYNYVMISLDYGQTFERVLYPAHDDFSQVASVSKDGLYFFFVSRDGVHRYSIGDKEWVVIRLNHLTNGQLTLDGIGINNACCFLNGEVFTFALCIIADSISTVGIYWKGTNLQSASYAANTLGRNYFTDLIYPDTKLTKSAIDSITMSISNVDNAVIAWLPGKTVDTSVFINLMGRTSETLIYFTTVLNKQYGSIQDFERLSIHPTSDILSFNGTRATVITIEDGMWYKTNIIIGLEDVSTSYSTFEYIEMIGVADNEGIPINLDIAYITNKSVYSVDGIASLPTELIGSVRTMTISVGKYFYIMLDGILYTNKLTVTNIASLVFTRTTNIPYTKVPTISYTGPQLLLGFDNTLMITDNIKDGSTLLLNLPELNNHSFSSSINGLLSISSIEIAIFLSNRVFILKKVADDLLGYRYDYLPTRLSTGIRPNDSTINTFDGKLTLYPTVQGLAIMNYQENIASTDQAVEYITNNIRAIWNEFYKAGSIKIVQMKDYIYLSNGTTTYLMIDLRGLTCWVLTSPFPVYKIVTDQIKFNIVSNALYKYDFDHLIYKDVLTRDIEWLAESQPNYFNAPVYYKNLKQLIFQLEESSIINQTINVQIKLYRKHFAIKEPEVISFTIDNYRTFVKRFNYWKINEMQWVLSSDPETVTPAQLKLNGLSIKYEISEEVRS